MGSNLLQTISNWAKLASRCAPKCCQTEAKCSRKCNLAFESSNISAANNLGVRYNKKISILKIWNSHSSNYSLPDTPENLISSIEVPSKALESKPHNMLITTIIILAVLFFLVTISVGTALGLSHSKVSDLMKLQTESTSTSGECFKRCGSINEKWKLVCPSCHSEALWNSTINKAWFKMIVNQIIRFKQTKPEKNILRKQRVQTNCDVSMYINPYYQGSIYQLNGLTIWQSTN